MNTSDEQLSLPVLGWLLHGVGLGLVLALAALFAIVVAFPLAGEQQSATAAQQALAEDLKMAKDVRAEHGALQKELQRLREQKTILRERITDGACEDLFLRQVTQAATDANLQLREYRPGSVTRHGDYGVMQIQLNCEGTYSSICTFLHELSKLARLTNVQRLQVASSTSSDVYPVMLIVEIYFALPGGATQSIEGRKRV